jgi:hypothetical protein|eukprot:Stramenopile-MAST_4_protein_1242
MAALSDEYGEFSVKKLAVELATAVEVEEERYLIDETKKKAIVVAHSYEDFKNRVACAKMKPMKSEELQELGKSNMFERAFNHNMTASREDRTVDILMNRASKKRTGRTVEEEQGRAAVVELKTTELPTTGPALDRDWWREGEDGPKFLLLRRIGSKTLKKIFKNHLPFDLVTDIFRVLRGSFDPGPEGEPAPGPSHAKLISKILIALSKSAGIGMFQFALTDKDKEVLRSLFACVEGVKEDIAHHVDMDAVSHAKDKFFA